MMGNEYRHSTAIWGRQEEMFAHDNVGHHMVAVVQHLPSFDKEHRSVHRQRQ